MQGKKFELLSLSANEPGNKTCVTISSEDQYDIGAVHMSRASPANRADLSHENLYFSTT